MPSLTLFPRPPLKNFRGPPPKWPLEDKVDAGVNTYQPFCDVPESILCNMQNPWRLTLANSAALSWTYRDPKPPPSLSLCDSTAHQAYRVYTEVVCKMPSWYNHFHIAVRSNQFKNHCSRAELLVKALDTWSLQEVDNLVYAFIGRACRFVDDDGCAVASFAQQVGHHFENHKRSAYDLFHHTFVRNLIGTFLACWDQNCAWSLSRRPGEMDAYISASLKLATFIGVCMRYGILNANDVYPCIRLLLNQATHVEYLDAVYNILEYSGDVFWKGVYDRERDVDAFLLRLGEDVEGVIREPRSFRVSPSNDSGRCLAKARWLYTSILETVERHGREGC